MNKDEVQSLIEENEKLVWYVLSKFYPNLLYDDDMYQMGMIGLWKAAETYEPEKGKFSTYATKCIKNSIMCELRKVYRQISKEELSLDELKRKEDNEWIRVSLGEYSSGKSKSIEDDLILKENLARVEGMLTKIQCKCLKEYIATENGAEAARNLGMSRSAFAATICRIRKKMDRVMKNGDD